MIPQGDFGILDVDTLGEGHLEHRSTEIVSARKTQESARSDLVQQLVEMDRTAAAEVGQVGWPRRAQPGVLVGKFDEHIPELLLSCVVLDRLDGLVGSESAIDSEVQDTWVGHARYFLASSNAIGTVASMQGIGDVATLEPGDVVVISGAPGSGKSELATTLAHRSGLPVSLFSPRFVPRSFGANEILGDALLMTSTDRADVEQMWTEFESVLDRSTVVVIDRGLDLASSSDHARRLRRALTASRRAAVVLCFTHPRVADAVAPPKAARVAVTCSIDPATGDQVLGAEWHCADGKAEWKREIRLPARASRSVRPT